MFGRHPVPPRRRPDAGRCHSARGRGPVRIKRERLAPENCRGTRELKSMGASWRRPRRTGSGLTVYAGQHPQRVERHRAHGRRRPAGRHADGHGLRSWTVRFNVFAIPFFFETDAELVHVQQKLRPCSSRARREEVRLIKLGQRRLVRCFLKNRSGRWPISRRRSSLRPRATTGTCAGMPPTDSTPCRSRPAKSRSSSSCRPARSTRHRCAGVRRRAPDLPGRAYMLDCRSRRWWAPRS